MMMLQRGSYHIRTGDTRGIDKRDYLFDKGKRRGDGEMDVSCGCRETVACVCGECDCSMVAFCCWNLCRLPYFPLYWYLFIYVYQNLFIFF